MFYSISGNCAYCIRVSLWTLIPRSKWTRKRIKHKQTSRKRQTPSSRSRIPILRPNWLPHGASNDDGNRPRTRIPQSPNRFHPHATPTRLRLLHLLPRHQNALLRPDSPPRRRTVPRHRPWIRRLPRQIRRKLPTLLTQPFRERNRAFDFACCV